MASGEGAGSSQTQARRAAALDACIKLHKARQLDNWLDPAEKGKRLKDSSSKYDLDLDGEAPLDRFVPFLVDHRRAFRSHRFL